MYEEKFEKADNAKRLEKDIRDLKYFIISLEVDFKKEKNKELLFSTISVKYEKQLEIFGSRIFSSDRHSSTVMIPFSFLPDLVDLAKSRLENLQKEYDALWAS